MKNICILDETYGGELLIGDGEYYKNNELPANTKRYVILFISEELIDMLIDKALDDCTDEFINDLYDILSDSGTLYTN